MTLLLDLLRHGQAAASGPRGDASRPLTDAGAEAIRALAEELARDPKRPERVFASPLDRAQQTAREILRGLALSIPLETLDALEPESEPDELVSALSALGVRDGSVLLVGHQPLLGRLSHFLTRQEYSFEPGTWIRLECSGPPAAGKARVLRILRNRDGRPAPG